jgi:hypothetical protein
MLSHPIVVSQLIFNFLCLMLLYSIYLCAVMTPSAYVKYLDHHYLHWVLCAQLFTANESAPILSFAGLCLNYNLGTVQWGHIIQGTFSQGDKNSQKNVWGRFIPGRIVTSPLGLGLNKCMFYINTNYVDH